MIATDGAVAVIATDAAAVIATDGADGPSAFPCAVFVGFCVFFPRLRTMTTNASSHAKSAEQPTSLLPLRELTARSARMATLKLAVFAPWEDQYTYMWDGKERIGTTFKCLLVDSADPTYYCHAECKKTKKSATAYEAAKTKYTEGATFMFSKIAFVEDARAAFLSAPKREVIHLLESTSRACVELSPTACPLQPCPSGSVADKLQLHDSQRFDITALVTSVSTLRAAGAERKAFDVSLLDGSSNPVTNKMKTMNVTMFSDHAQAEKDQAFVADCQSRKVPVTFLQLSGSKDATGKFAFQSAWKGWRMVFASVEQPGSNKAQQLKEQADAFLSNSDIEGFDQKTYERTDFSALHGIETTVRLFKTLPRLDCGIDDLDEEQTVWQINWVRVCEPPPGGAIRTSDGVRLWFSVCFGDSTAQHKLFITQNAALKLAGCDSVEEFENAHKAANLWFPLVSSLKIVRKRSSADASNGAAFDAVIVDASEQDLKQVPTMSSTMLIDMLAARIDEGRVFLPGALHMIKKSMHYGMCVQYEQQTLLDELSNDLLPESSEKDKLVRPCSQVFALIEADRASVLHNIGEDGYKLCTSNVRDVLAPDDTTTYDLTAFCTLKNLQDFKLDPPRGTKKQSALIIISDVIDSSAAQPVKTFIVDSILLLPRQDVAEIKEAVSKLLYYVAAGTEVIHRKRKREWNETFSPAKARMCRSLSRHPSGPSLPCYSTPTKSQ